MSQAVLDPPAAAVPLRRNVAFQLLWSGSAFMLLGSEITGLVYPLIVLTLTGSPASAGLVAATQIFTALLLGLPAGALADRHDRRLLLLVADGVRILTTGAVLVAALAGGLALPHLLGAAVLLGAVQPLGGAARMLLVRALVPDSQLTAALTQEEVRSHGASLAGPPLGGALYAVSAAAPLLATALSYVASFVCVLFVRTPPRSEPVAAAAPSGLARTLGGLAVLWHASDLRRIALFTFALNLASAPMVLVAVVQLTDQRLPSAAIGLVTAGLAAGGLTGAALVRPLHRTFAPGRLMLAVAASMIVLLICLGLSWGPWWLGAVLFAEMLAVPAIRVLVDILIFRQVGPDQRGRVVAATMTLFGLGATLGTLLGGLLLEHLSPLATTLTIAAALACTLALAATNTPLRTTPWPPVLCADARADSV